MVKKLTNEKDIDPLSRKIIPRESSHLGVKKGKMAFFAEDWVNEIPLGRVTRRKRRYVKIPKEAHSCQMPDFCAPVSGFYYGELVFFNAKDEEIERCTISKTRHPLLEGESQVP